MVVTQSGVLDTIGGGELEHRAVLEAQNAIRREESGYWHRNWSLGPELGQCCGGYVVLLFEPFGPEHIGEIEALASEENRGPFLSRAYAKDGRFPRDVKNIESIASSFQFMYKRNLELHERFGSEYTPLTLFGAGHVAKALILTLAPLPFSVTIYDNRPDIFPSFSPTNFKFVTGFQPIAAIKHAPAKSQILIMTHDHALDLEILHAALSADRFSYIGLIGSQTKKARFIKRLRESGLTEELIKAMTCPVGVAEIKSKQPAHIAIAIAAQLLIYREREQLRQSNDPT